MANYAYGDGFDNTTVAKLGRRYDILGGAISSCTLVTSRIGSGNALQFPQIASGGDAHSIQKNFNDSFSSIISGFGFRWNSGGFANAYIMRFRDALSDQIRLMRNGVGNLIVQRGDGTTLATSVQALAQSTWYFIEFIVTIHNTTGSYQVWVDGVQWMSATNVNTRQSSNNFATSFLFGTIENGGVCIFDDLYVLNGANSGGGYPNTRLGDVKVGTYFLTAAGTDADFTPLSSTNVSNVDDNPSSDDDTTYNESSTVNHKDTFKATNPGLQSSATVHWVQSVSEVRKTDAGSSVMRGIVRSNGTYGEGADFAPSTVYRTMIGVFPQNPDTSAAWAYNAVENTNLEVGYKKTA